MAKRKTTNKESDAVRASLIEQLTIQGKTAAYYTNLVDDYMSYWEVKQGLLDDIKTRGAVVEGVSGNGFPFKKPNESIAILNKTTATMLKILADLNLREITTTKAADNPEDYF